VLQSPEYVPANLDAAESWFWALSLMLQLRVCSVQVSCIVRGRSTLAGQIRQLPGADGLRHRFVPDSRQEVARADVRQVRLVLASVLLC